MPDRTDTTPPHEGQEEPRAPGLVERDRASEVVGAPPPSADDPTPARRPRLGAAPLPDGSCQFRVWAPKPREVVLHLVRPEEQRIPMRGDENGYWETTVPNCGPGAHYFYALDGSDRPDPASRLQPLGVHGPSEVVGDGFPWHDGTWPGLPLDDYVVYELHVGTFTPEGTFDAIIPHLDRLREIGITVVELLPVGQFPGTRNWGYDGVFVGAVQSSYGGPAGLKRLVDACHQREMALALDVVYNHLGPEGNYLSEYAPYFTDRYKTPWGLALNFDGPSSDEVRWFFIHNALQWIDEFHVDALRVDAVHAIVDHTAEPFLQDLTSAVARRAGELGRRVVTIAESDLNDPRVITPRDRLGLGFDTQWNDDFHHSLHTLLTGENDGYYQGFGRVSDLARVLRNGYLYVGQHSAYRGRKYGLHPQTNDGRKFVVFAQNHDQVGNRMHGDRLTTLVGPGKTRLAAVAVALSPFVPMLFMGEEYGETAPFQYFTSHSDEELIEAVRRGRREEFDDFKWEGEPPDPHDEETLRRSRLQWERLDHDEHRALRDLWRELLRLRRERPALRALDLSKVEATADDEAGTLVVRRWNDGDEVLVIFNFGESEREIQLPSSRQWTPILANGAQLENGWLRMSPISFAVCG